MHPKHLMSPKGGENATPMPHDKGEMDGKDRGKAGNGHHMHSAKGGENHTPDMMGRLFDHKPNMRGV